MALAILILYIIYNSCNNKTNYVSITDYYINNSNYNNYIYDYLNTNNKLGTFINEFNNKDIKKIYVDIKNNRTIRVNNKDLYFKKVLRESDIVVINVGMSELSRNYDKYEMKNNNDVFEKIFFNLQILMNELKKYSKGTIIYVGLYNPTNYYDASVDSFFNNLNHKLRKLMEENGIVYLDIYELYKNDKHAIDRKIADIIKYYI